MPTLMLRAAPAGLAAAALAMLAAGVAGPALAVGSPLIRTSAENTVPRCVTPERLMAYLKSRNGRLDPRFADIARHYKAAGETWRVRWDYAFFQMAIETNYLTYRQPNGRMGDVDPRQNNFAGIGTTGGGVPGDSFPDVKTGVLAQIQHLVVYSGEQIAEPVAPRTRLKQDVILTASRGLNRPVRFADLARRWAVDPKYGQSIEWAAEQFRTAYCRGKEPAATAAAGAGIVEVLPWSNAPAEPGAVPARPAAAAAKPKAKPPVAAKPRVPEAKAGAAGAAHHDNAAVRTIWSRTNGKAPSAVATATKIAAPPAAVAVAEVIPAGEVAPTTAPVAILNAAPIETGASAPAASPPDGMADASESDEGAGHFALIAPPKGWMPEAPAAAEPANVAAPVATATATPVAKPTSPIVARPITTVPVSPAALPAVAPAERPAAADEASVVDDSSADDKAPRIDLAANPPSRLGMGPGASPPQPPKTCPLNEASYGGNRTVLVRTGRDRTRYTALAVKAGFEESMAATFIRTQAGGGEQVGVFDSREAAAARAHELCAGQ